MYRHMFIIFIIIIGLQITLIKNTYTKDFDLVDISGHWAEQKVRTLVNEGVIIGYPDQTFHPDHPITRAEAAMILSHFSQSKQKSASTTFTDMNHIPAWARKAVTDVTQTHIMNGYLDQTFRPTHFLSRKEAIQIVSVMTQKNSAEVKSNATELDSSPYVTRAEFCSIIVENKLNV